MSIREQAPAVVVGVSAKDWYWALTTARSVHRDVLEQTDPAGTIVTKAANEFWASNPRTGVRQGKWQAQVDAYDRSTYFLMKRGNDTAGGFSVVDGELCGLWVEQRRHGYGTWLLRAAVRRGAVRLSCFEHLIPFYKLADFVEVKRFPNWNAGGPDVVLMEVRDVRDAS